MDLDMQQHSECINQVGYFHLHYFLFCTALMKTTVCSRNVTYNYIFWLEYWTFACDYVCPT